jgi:hypothetical protein
MYATPHTAKNTTTPTMAMLRTKRVICCCSGVGGTSISASEVLILPSCVPLPTAVTR